MQNYINQLSDDILEACRVAEIQDQLNSHEDDDEGEAAIQSAENFVYGDTEPLSSITGIAPIVLPPPERLTQEQKSQLAGVLEKLLIIKKFLPEFPHQLPMHRRYQFLREMWSEEFAPPLTGHVHVQFCQYIPEECPFPEYCDHCGEFDDNIVEIHSPFDEDDFNDDFDPNSFFDGPAPF